MATAAITVPTAPAVNNNRMSGRKGVLVWVGVSLVVAGLAVLLMVWLGLDRANEYIGVPAAVASLVGLVLSSYGLIGARPAKRVEQVVDDSDIRGSNLMIGRLDGRRTGRGASSESEDGAGAAGPGISQAVRRTKIGGNNTIIGQATDGTDPGGEA
jgi:hypothetical protein